MTARIIQKGRIARKYVRSGRYAHSIEIEQANLPPIKTLQQPPPLQEFLQGFRFGVWLKHFLQALVERIHSLLVHSQLMQLA
jgi:hypothetical protein